MMMMMMMTRTLNTLFVASHTSCSRAKVICLQFTLFDSDLRPLASWKLLLDFNAFDEKSSQSEATVSQVF